MKPVKTFDILLSFLEVFILSPNGVNILSLSNPNDRKYDKNIPIINHIINPINISLIF